MVSEDRVAVVDEGVVEGGDCSGSDIGAVRSVVISVSPGGGGICPRRMGRGGRGANGIELPAF